MTLFGKTHSYQIDFISLPVSIIAIIFMVANKDQLNYVVILGKCSPGELGTY